MGGSNNIGTIYRLSANGTLTTLHSFAGGSDGGYPLAPLLQESDGALYGTTEDPGFLNAPGGYGTVFRITTNGVLTTLYAFSADINGADPTTSLARGIDGSLYGTTSSGSAEPASNPSSGGTVFRITTNGTLTTLYDFSGSGSAGASPSGSLLLASDGSFYGTTAAGGPGGFSAISGNYGTVFRITTNGVMTMLYSFTGYTNGAAPSGGLTLGADGNLYGTTSGGGLTSAQSPVPQYGYGTFFALLATHPPILTAQPQGQTGSSGQTLTLTVGATSNIPLGYQWQFNGTNIPGAGNPTLILPNVNAGQSGGYQVVVTNLGGSVTSAMATVTVQPAPAWGYSLVHAFGVGGGPFNSLAGVVQGPDGNLYGTSANGGAYGWGTLFRVSPGAGLTLLYSFTGGADGGAPKAALTTGADGNLYGTAYGGGSNGLGTVFRFTTNGMLTPLYSFTGGEDGGYPQAGLVQAADGDFYGTTSGVGLNEGTVFRITTNGLLTTLHEFTGPDGISVEAGLVQGSDGVLYGTTLYGGTNATGTLDSAGTLFSITTNGDFTSLYVFQGSDGYDPQCSLVQGGDGSLCGTTTSGGTNRLGSVFRFAPDGSLTNIHSFSGPDGQDPTAGLVLGKDGNLYGTTFLGGSNNFGTVFRVTTNGVVTSLRSFSGGPDGRDPQCALWQDANGNLYGTTSGDGAAGAGTVFEITTTGALTTLAALTNGDGLNPAAGLTLGEDGGLYGTTEGGGANGFGSVFRVTSSGACLVLYSFTGGAEGKTPLAGLTRGTDGNFYGTTSAGGPTNGGALFVITTNGVLTPLYSFTGATDGAAPHAALTLAGDGAIYGTTYTGGTNNLGTVFRVTTNGALTTLYSFASTDLGRSQSALVQGSDGALYGAASSHSQFISQGSLFKITTNGVFTPLDQFPNTNKIGGPYGGLIQGADGNFYGTTYGHPALPGVSLPQGSDGTIFQMTPEGILTILYTFSGGSDGGEPQAALIQGADGNLYGSTCAGGLETFGTLFQISPGGVFTTLYSFTNGIPYYSPFFGVNPVASLVQGSDGDFYGTTYAGGAQNQGTVFALIPPTAAVPVIGLQPLSQSGLPGGSVTFNTTVAGAAPLNYQWEFNGIAIPGATNNALTLTHLNAALAGGYNVIVSNSLGASTSSVARLPFFGLALADSGADSSPLLTLGDIPGSNYRIDVSSDLSNSNNWSALANLTLTNSPVLFADPSGPLSTNRFYRAILLP
jgi:uncharacterized repeat protein (TIGR03803 family)